MEHQSSGILECLSMLGTLVVAVWVVWSKIVHPRTPTYVNADGDDETAIIDDEISNNNGTATPLQPFATPQTDVATLLDRDHIIAGLLADLIVESRVKPFAGGLIGETRALKIGYGVVQSSTSVRYREVRELLKTAIEQRSVPRFRPVEPAPKIAPNRLDRPEGGWR